jgi:hypothetical protein
MSETGKPIGISMHQQLVRPAAISQVNAAPHDAHVLFFASASIPTNNLPEWSAHLIANSVHLHSALFI